VPKIMQYLETRDYELEEDISGPDRGKGGPLSREKTVGWQMIV